MKKKDRSLSLLYLLMRELKLWLSKRTVIHPFLLVVSFQNYSIWASFPGSHMSNTVLYSKFEMSAL